MKIPGPSFRAGGTIGPFLAVTMDTTADNQVIQVSATNQPIIGIAQEGQAGAPGVAGSDTTIAATSGQGIDVIGMTNVALVYAGAAITRGDRLTANTSGQLITLAAGSPSRQFIAGVALESASGAGVLIRMLVQPQEVWF